LTRPQKSENSFLAFCKMYTPKTDDRLLRIYKAEIGTENLAVRGSIRVDTHK
jgi:hypothetical protein